MTDLGKTTLGRAVRTRATQHLSAVVATGGSSRAWAARFAGGGAIAASGVALLRFVTSAPWYVGVGLVVIGIDYASNGIVRRGAKAIVDIVKDVRNGKPEGTP